MPQAWVLSLVLVITSQLDGTTCGVVGNDLASIGWETRQTRDSFWEWFDSGINDFIEFD